MSILYLSYQKFEILLENNFTLISSNLKKKNSKEECK